MAPNMDALIEESVRKSVWRINNVLEGFREERNTLLNDLKQWYPARRNTIKALKEFQVEFNNIFKDCSAVRAFGAGSISLGSFVSIIGYALSFTNLKLLSDVLITYGGGAGAVGCAVGISCPLIEMGLNAMVLKKVSKALRDDQKITDRLLPWFRRANEVDSLFQELFDCSVISDKAADILKFLSDLCVLGRESSVVYQKITDYLAFEIDDLSITGLSRGNIERIYNFLSSASVKVLRFLKEFCENPRVRIAVMALCGTVTNYPEIFELSKVSSCIVQHMSGQENALCSLISLTGSNISITGLQCTFLAVALGLSMIVCFKAANDFKNGKSKYFDMLEKTKGCLSLELEKLETLLSSYSCN